MALPEVARKFAITLKNNLEVNKKELAVRLINLYSPIRQHQEIETHLLEYIEAINGLGEEKYEVVPENEEDKNEIHLTHMRFDNIKRIK